MSSELVCTNSCAEQSTTTRKVLTTVYNRYDILLLDLVHRLTLFLKLYFSEAGYASVLR